MTDPIVPDQPPVPPTPPAAPMGVTPAKPSTVLSLLSMIAGIIGVLLACCFGAGFLFSVGAIVMGFLGKKKENARGMAMTGLITGFVGAGLAVITWIILAVSPALLSFIPGVTTYSNFGY